MTLPALLAVLAAVALTAAPIDASAGIGSRPPFPAAKPLPPGARPAAAAPASRGEKPLLTATSSGAGQAGYVHYFIIELPDESLEIQVGIELADRRIAWSFPGLGVTVSPFMAEGVVSAQGQDYGVWHLYGIRPFADDEAMAALARSLTPRVEAWARAGIPYCLSDAGRGNCMSCLGFVLRVLYPPRAGDYPSLPRALARAGSTSTGYSPNDLLLHLTGMLDLATREARLQRLSRLTLPEDLRDDLEALLYQSAGSTLADAPPSAAPRRSGAPAPKAGSRSTLRRRL